MRKLLFVFLAVLSCSAQANVYVLIEVDQTGDPPNKGELFCEMGYTQAQDASTYYAAQGYCHLKKGSGAQASTLAYALTLTGMPYPPWSSIKNIRSCPFGAWTGYNDVTFFANSGSDTHIRLTWIPETWTWSCYC